MSPMSSDDDDDDDDARARAYDASGAGAGAGASEDALARVRAMHARSSAPSSARVVRTSDAIRDVLVASDVEVNATSIFAATFSALESALGGFEGGGSGGGASGGQGEALDAALACAAEAMSDVEDRIIRAKAEQICEVLMRCGKVVSEHVPKSMRYVGKCLARCASGASAEAGEKHGKRAFQATLNLTIDGRPKVRKTAVFAVSDVLRRTRGSAIGATYCGMVAAYAEKIGGAPEREAAEMQKGARRGWGEGCARARHGCGDRGTVYAGRDEDGATRARRAGGWYVRRRVRRIVGFGRTFINAARH